MQTAVPAVCIQNGKQLGQLLDTDSYPTLNYSTLRSLSLITAASKENRPLSSLPYVGCRIRNAADI